MYIKRAADLYDGEDVRDVIVASDELIASAGYLADRISVNLEQVEDGKVLIILDIFKGEETPYYYSGDGVLEAYVRVGNESVKATSTGGYEFQINYDESKKPSFRSDRYQFTVVMPNLNYNVPQKKRE